MEIDSCIVCSPEFGCFDGVRNATIRVSPIVGQVAVLRQRKEDIHKTLSVVCASGQLVFERMLDSNVKMIHFNWTLSNDLICIYDSGIVDILTPTGKKISVHLPGSEEYNWAQLIEDQLFIITKSQKLFRIPSVYGLPSFESESIVLSHLVPGVPHFDAIMVVPQSDDDGAEVWVTFSDEEGNPMLWIAELSENFLSENSTPNYDDDETEDEDFEYKPDAPLSGLYRANINSINLKEYSWMEAFVGGRSWCEGMSCNANGSKVALICKRPSDSFLDDSLSTENSPQRLIVMTSKLDKVIVDVKCVTRKLNNEIRWIGEDTVAFSAMTEHNESCIMLMNTVTGNANEEFFDDDEIWMDSYADGILVLGSDWKFLRPTPISLRRLREDYCEELEKHLRSITQERLQQSLKLLLHCAVESNDFEEQIIALSTAGKVKKLICERTTEIRLRKQLSKLYCTTAQQVKLKRFLRDGGIFLSQDHLIGIWNHNDGPGAALLAVCCSQSAFVLGFHIVKEFKMGSKADAHVITEWCRQLISRAQDREYSGISSFNIEDDILDRISANVNGKGEAKEYIKFGKLAMLAAAYDLRKLAIGLNYMENDILTKARVFCDLDEIEEALKLAAETSDHSLRVTVIQRLFMLNESREVPVRESFLQIIVKQFRSLIPAVDALLKTTNEDTYQDWLMLCGRYEEASSFIIWRISNIPHPTRKQLSSKTMTTYERAVSNREQRLKLTEDAKKILHNPMFEHNHIITEMKWLLDAQDERSTEWLGLTASDTYRRLIEDGITQGRKHSNDVASRLRKHLSVDSQITTFAKMRAFARTGSIEDLRGMAGMPKHTIGTMVTGSVKPPKIGFEAFVMVCLFDMSHPSEALLYANQIPKLKDRVRIIEKISVWIQKRLNNIHPCDDEDELRVVYDEVTQHILQYRQRELTQEEKRNVPIEDDDSLFSNVSNMFGRL